MSRQRVSTTVDDDLLDRARCLESWPNDAAMLDAALKSLVARYRAAEIDAAYEAYDRCPLDEPDEWGCLASFHEENRTARQNDGTTGERPQATDVSR